LFVCSLLTMTLSFTLHDSNKENQPSTALSQRHCRVTVENPHVTMKKVLTAKAPFCNSKDSQESAISHVKPTVKATSSTATQVKHGSKHSSSASLATIEEEETSPTVRWILAASGCSNRQDCLAMKAAQTNMNGSTSTMNPSKASAPNGPKTAATNGAQSVSTNGTKATNGSKSMNPKKKVKSKCVACTLDTLTPKWCHSLNVQSYIQQLQMDPSLRLLREPSLWLQIRRDPSLRRQMDPNQRLLHSNWLQLHSYPMACIFQCEFVDPGFPFHLTPMSFALRVTNLP